MTDVDVAKRLDFQDVSLHPSEDPLVATGGQEDVNRALEDPSVENFKR